MTSKLAFPAAAKAAVLTMIMATAGLMALPASAQTQAPRDYPREVTVPAIPGVVAAGAKWTIFWSGLDNADGLVGTPDGGIIFAQREVSRIRKIGPDGKTSVLLEDTHGAGALGIDYQGRIVAVMRDRPSLGYLTPEPKLLTDNFQGQPLTGAGDLVVDKKGGIYFTETRRKPTSRVHYFGPDGKMFTFGDGMRTNGLAISPDEKTLYLSDANAIVAIDLNPDGTEKSRRKLVTLDGEGVAGDGMAVDSDGRIYVSTHIGAQVVSPDGKLLGVIPTPRPPLSLAFSGPDKKTLFMTGTGAVDAQGVEHPVSPAKTIYRLSMLAQGFKGRAK